jgi:tetratricopeptide (TPR) repeat protein
MPIISDKELPPDKRSLWLKALSAVELRNYGYAISLIGAVLKDSPGFLDGRKMLRKAEIAATKGKKSFLSGLSTASLKGSSMVKKDPLSAMELAEKNLESDPLGAAPNHLLKDAAKAANFPEIAVFALETIIAGAPEDVKVMHELAELLLSMGEADKAVEVYNKISAINPQDLVATKRGKDASAQASMKSGGWEQASSYRDIMKNKDEAVSLEQQARVVRSLDMIEQQLAEFMPQWEADQQQVDLSRRIAKLWEERFEQMQDDESLDGAIWYANHLNSVLNGSDPAIKRKLSDLQLKRADAAIRKVETDTKAIEEWLAAVAGTGHEDEAKYREHLAELQRQLPELKLERGKTLIDESKHRVERNPTDLALRFELGERLLEAGLFNEAIPELQRARQNPNARLKAMSLLGRCFVLKGMLDMAASQFQAAATEMTAMDNFKKDTLYDLALVNEKMGKKDDYLRCLKDIMEVDYGYKDVAQRVETTYGT